MPNSGTGRGRAQDRARVAGGQDHEVLRCRPGGLCPKQRTAATGLLRLPKSPIDPACCKLAPPATANLRDLILRPTSSWTTLPLGGDT